MTEESISRGRFMRLGGALGVGVASASLLASCGGESGNSSGGGSGGGSSSGSGGSGGGGAGAIAQVSDVQAGSAVQFQNDGDPAVLVHLQNGDFAAYSAVCTHQGCTVAYAPEEGTLDCPCHGSIFDPANGGEAVKGPAQQPLSDIPVNVRDGQVVRA
ncbi:QcrA and Rieske domain-containing protein [Rubrobacter aplysinae]|uniref:QcrA and Rieske domain-containing protein n=1 Tax=Rubrobacter aplysinae TaxID=909625 RepID=UPI00064C0B60|nr:Rieske (2Fe-2S) protein [Rubrobacter aplysinae]